jgi:hypothetical protein
MIIKLQYISLGVLLFSSIAVLSLLIWEMFELRIRIWRFKKNRENKKINLQVLEVGQWRDCDVYVYQIIKIDKKNIYYKVVGKGKHPIWKQLYNEKIGQELTLELTYPIHYHEIVPNSHTPLFRLLYEI